VTTLKILKFVIAAALLLLISVNLTSADVLETDVIFETSDSVELSSYASEEFTKSLDGVQLSADLDTSKITVSKTDETITVTSSVHDEGCIKVALSDLQEIEPSYTENDFLYVQHFNETDYNDWNKVVGPDFVDGYTAILVNFSTVTVTPYVSSESPKAWNFETWSGTPSLPAYWTTAYTSTVSADSYAAVGNYSLKISPNGSTYAGGLSQTIHVSKNANYVLGAYVNTLYRSSGWLTIDLVKSSVGWDDAGITVSGNTNGWTYYTANVYTLDDYPDIRIFTTDANADSIWGVDAVTLSPAGSSVSMTETVGSSAAVQTSTYTPSAVLSSAVYITEFDSDLSSRGYLCYTATVDGSAVSCWGAQDGRAYVDVSGLTASSHTIVVTAHLACAPTMLSPTNGSTITFDYPPMYDEVTFSWADFTGTSQIQIAEDSAFSNVVYSDETTDNSVTASLAAGTYYWRVRSYDSVTGSYGSWPSSYSVILVSSSGSVTGTGVMGTVYYAAGLGDYQYISGAVVTLYNDTYTVQKTTGSVGYFQILGLVNGTYYVYAEADGYDTSAIAALNVTAGTVSVQDISMQKEQSYFAPHYVTFYVSEKTWYGSRTLSNALVTVYVNSNTNSYASQYTGSDGGCGFELSENVRYRLVIEYDGETQTEYITPTATTYYITFGEQDDYLIPGEQFQDYVNITVDKDEINSTDAEVTVTYNDSLSNTTSVYCAIGHIENGAFNATETGNTSYGNTTWTFGISDYLGEDYIVKVYIDHVNFGSVTKTYSVSFAGSELPFTGKSMGILAVVILFFVAAMFGRADSAGGAIILVGVASMFWYLGMFEAFGSTINDLVFTGIICAAAYALMSYFKEKKTGGI
jgi:hypothetical protein